MNREQIKIMMHESGLIDWFNSENDEYIDFVNSIGKFAALVAAAEREKVALWMTERGYATGHGDTIEDLLTELDWQIREQEREACAKVVEILIPEQTEDGLIGHTIVKAIRARGGK